MSLHGRAIESDHPASAAERAAARFVVGRRDAGPARAAARRTRHGALEAHNLRGDGRGEGKIARRACRGLRRFDDVAPLNTIALEVVAAPDARVVPRAGGLPDALFEHDGQITKREIRAMTLAALAPRRGELLWDIGAGCGSVAIEWMLCDPANRAFAIEQRPDRAARIARNAAALRRSRPRRG